MYHIYALSSPESPTEIRYIGRTGVTPTKRFHDHLAQVRYRVRHGKKLTPVMVWIKELLDKNQQPVNNVLSSVPDEEAAIQAEMTLVNALAGLILNDPNALMCYSGKKVGCYDSRESIKNKVEAAARRDQDMVYNAYLQNHIKKRIEAGYPNPRESVFHPDNLNHYYQLKGMSPPNPRRKVPRPEIGVKMTQAYREWRQRIGCPHPDLSIWHRLNRQWLRQNYHSIEPFKNNRRRV